LQRRSVSDAQRESRSAYRLLWELLKELLVLLVLLVLRMNSPALQLQARPFGRARCSGTA
jgi:hypothetical protein